MPREFSPQPLQQFFEQQFVNSAELKSVFYLYDAEGEILASSLDNPVSPKENPKWFSTLKESSFVDFWYYENELRYALKIATPIIDPETGQRLGVLTENQSVEELFDFLLDTAEKQEGVWAPKNNYEVIYLGDDKQFSVYLDQGSTTTEPVLRYGKVDQRLAQRLRRSPERDSDSFFLWRYQSRGQKSPVLMAFHRLYHLPVFSSISENPPVYLVVYRPASAVFANINLGALLTVIVTSVVIVVFYLIGYRIINNDIIRPVSLLNEGAQIIREGDLELKLRVDTGDEIEQLALSFNDMAATLRQNIAQVQASKEKYLNLITSMRDGIYQTDAQGAITFLNPAAAHIFGYGNPEDALKSHVRTLFLEQMDYEHIKGELARHNFIERARVWMTTAQNQSICLEVSANQVFDDENTFIGVEGTFRDVTQNVRLEQEARERADRISAINQITNVINSSLEAGRVFENIVVEVRKLVDFDYATLSLFTEEKATETHLLWPETDGVHVHSGEDACAQWVAEKQDYLVISELQTAESPFTSYFPDYIRSCLAVPLYATGRIIGSLNLGGRKQHGFGSHEIDVARQLTPHLAVAIRNAQLLRNLKASLEEVTQAREKLHEANEELKTLDEMKTNLLSNVSHELRTPLVAVMGYTDMILNGKVGPINEVQQEYLGISVRNIEKLVTLIENLLDFSRLHRGAEEMVYDTLDLVDCARTSIQIVKPVADSREIEILLNVPESTGGKILVDGDKGKLGQVFNNLLSNAVKFNPNGGNVTIDMRVTETTVEVAVSDTGIGIPEEALDKVFTRFYQYDGSSTRKYGGTGIGLSIAQDIMRLHGSRLTVTSPPGEGATFRFSLPLNGIHRRSQSGDTHAAQLPMPTETHLLVELVTQDRALSAQIRHLLFSEGMDVIHAAYPSVAVSLATKYNPDCILVDTEAGPLGSVVLEEVLSAPCAHEVPVIMLSNDEQLYERYRAVASSDEDYVLGSLAPVAGRIKRGFRKSTLLSGIHYALSKGVVSEVQLGEKILCVDDDPEIVRFIARCLETEGYTAEQCSSGDEAVQRVKSRDYWLVLLDIAMPGLNGWETCKAIKKDAALAGIKVYMVTAKPIEKERTKVREVGADGYLSKPFKAEDLVELVQGLDPKRAAQAEEHKQQEPPQETSPIA